MSSATIRSLAVRASAALAVAALAACSTESTPTTPGVSLRGPSQTVIIGGANSGAAQLALCKWSDQSGVTYDFTVTKLSGPGTLLQSGAVQITPTTPIIDGTGEYLPYRFENCVGILNDATPGVTTIRVTETQKPGIVLGVLTGDGNATTFTTNDATWTTEVGVSEVQAARIYFKNSGVEIPPPSEGCTYTHGWYKNKGNSTVPTIPFFGPVVGGVNTGPVNWRTQVGLKANKYDKLAYQYIAAKLSVGAGTPPAAVAAALASAEAFFTNRTQGTGTPPAGVAETLDSFVNGNFAGWPHCD